MLEENSENIYKSKKICSDEKFVFATGYQKKRNSITSKSLDGTSFRLILKLINGILDPTNQIKIVFQPLFIVTKSVLF